MNKRQKKKLYKKLHGHNPPKEPKKQQPQRTEAQQTKDVAKTIAELSNLITERMCKAAEEIKEIGRLISKSFIECLTLPCIQSVIKTAEEYEKQQAAQEIYITVEFVKEPPCVVTAKVLTRQRAAGKRKKYHTRTRRNSHGRN